MTNKYTGEVDIKIKDKVYKIVYDWRAISEYQTKFGKDADLNNFTLEQIAETLLIGLQKHHKEEITLDDIFEASPPMSYVSDCIVEAFIYAQHGPEEGSKIIDDAKNLVDDVKKKMKSPKV